MLEAGQIAKVNALPNKGQLPKLFAPHPKAETQIDFGKLLANQKSTAAPGSTPGVDQNWLKNQTS